MDSPDRPPCTIPSSADFSPSCASHETNWSPSHISGVCVGVREDADREKKNPSP